MGFPVAIESHDEWGSASAPTSSRSKRSKSRTRCDPDRHAMCAPMPVERVGADAALSSLTMATATADVHVLSAEASVVELWATDTARANTQDQETVRQADRTVPGHQAQDARRMIAGNREGHRRRVGCGPRDRDASQTIGTSARRRSSSPPRGWRQPLHRRPRTMPPTASRGTAASAT